MQGTEKTNKIEDEQNVIEHTSAEGIDFEELKEEDFFEKDLDAPLDDDYNEEDLPEREYIPMPSIFEPIPEEAQKEILSNFALRKREKEEEVAVSAQRLVNQFRALSAFRDDYVVTYNKDLMTASDDIIAYLPNIIGGPSVREYLDYLKAQKLMGKEYDDKNIDFSISKKSGYLPMPTDETTPATGKTSLSGQADFLSETLLKMQTAIDNQAKNLADVINLFKETLESKPPQTENTLFNHGANELINAQREMMEHALEKMVQMQSGLFTETVDKLAQTVEQMKEQFRPSGSLRQAMSSLKASAEQKEKAESKQSKKSVPEPMLQSDVMKEIAEELRPFVPENKKSTRPYKEEKSFSEEGDFEILSEFDILSD